MLIAFKSHREGILDRATNKRRKESQRDGISDKMNQFVRSKEYGRLAKRLLSYPKYSVPAGLNLPCSCNMLSKIPSLQYSISCVTITCYLKYRPAGTQMQTDLALSQPASFKDYTLKNLIWFLVLNSLI
jgi:hypothetical protein